MQLGGPEHTKEAYRMVLIGKEGRIARGTILSTLRVEDIRLNSYVLFT